MRAGYYIKVEHLFWTGRYWRGQLVLTERATRAMRLSVRSIAEEVLEEVQSGYNPTATLITHLSSECDSPTI